MDKGRDRHVKRTNKWSDVRFEYSTVEPNKDLDVCEFQFITNPPNHIYFFQ